MPSPPPNRNTHRHIRQWHPHQLNNFFLLLLGRKTTFRLFANSHLPSTYWTLFDTQYDSLDLLTISDYWEALFDFFSVFNRLLVSQMSNSPVNRQCSHQCRANKFWWWWKSTFVFLVLQLVDQKWVANWCVVFNCVSIVIMVLTIVEQLQM